MLKVLATAAALSLATFAADAATVTQLPTPGVALANPTSATFTGTYFENVSDFGQGGVRRSPWEGTALDGSVYSSITGSLTFTFAKFADAFSLVWGSPDDYNKLEFYNGTTLVDTVLGAAISPCCNSGQLNIPNSLVNISTDAWFNKVVFTSGQPAFEFANVSASEVPLPAGGLLLLGGLGALAATRRRRAA
jgi:hypothetical protein